MSNVTDSPTLPSMLSSIQKQMTLYGMSLILFFGVGGNLINCCVFLQKSLRSNSCSIYLIASSISHTILIMLAMSTNLYSFGNIDPLTYSLAYCKIRPYLISSLFMISRTFIVLACVDRYALCSPHANVRAFSRSQTAFRFIPVVIGIWLFVPCHILIFNTIEKNRCIMPGLYSYLYAAYTVVCAGILPPSLMIIFGLLARHNLQLLRQRVVPASVGGGSRMRIKNVDYQIMKVGHALLYSFFYIDVNFEFYQIDALCRSGYLLYFDITISDQYRLCICDNERHQKQRSDGHRQFLDISHWLNLTVHECLNCHVFQSGHIRSFSGCIEEISHASDEAWLYISN